MMLAFDCQMKRLGFSGNQAQIILGLDGLLPEAELIDRVHALKESFPILAAVIKRGLFNWNPYWKINCAAAHTYPRVRCHHAENEQELDRINGNILNRRLDIQKGELVCFDLVYRGNSDVAVVMTWSHMLMDAHGAEYFLAMIGRSVAVGDGVTQSDMLSGSYNEKMAGGSNWPQTQKSFQRVDELAVNPPVSLYTRAGHSLASRLDYRVVSFTRNQTRIIREMAEKHGGFLNESAYYSAAAMGEFRRLMASRNIFPAGYVMPVSIDLRKKGTRLPVFSNQSATLLYGFTPEELLDYESILASFARQTQEAIYNDMIGSNVSAMEFCRFIPSRFYAMKILQAFKGEIASFVFANPGKGLDELSTFMGRRVKFQHHVPTIVVPPGMGIVFYTFSDRLHITLVYVESLIPSNEVDDFLGAVGRHLMSGKLT